MESLTERLRTKLELTYDGIWDTPHSFQYLTRFSKPSSSFVSTTHPILIVVGYIFSQV